MDFLQEVLTLVAKETERVREQMPKFPTEKDRYDYLVTLMNSEKLEVREAAKRILTDYGPDFGREPTAFNL